MKEILIKVINKIKAIVKKVINKTKVIMKKLRRVPNDLKKKTITIIRKKKKNGTKDFSVLDSDTDTYTDTILILTHTQMYFDDRIKRQANALVKEYRVILFAKQDERGIFPPGLSKQVELIEYKNLNSRGSVGQRILSLFIKEKKTFWDKLLVTVLKASFGANEEKLYFDYLPIYQEAYRDLLKYIEEEELSGSIKSIIANDVFVLPIVDRIRRYILSKKDIRIPMIGDMHEVHFNYNAANIFNQSLRKWLCAQYLPRLNLVISVSNQGADLYNTNFRLKDVMSIMNVPSYEIVPLDGKETVMDSKVKLVHTGVASPERKLEDMIKAMVRLQPKYELYFHLTSNQSVNVQNYLTSLKDLICSLGLESRVFLKETLKPDQLVKHISQYDIGVFYMGDVMANHQYAMPNKLFQYIMARLGVVVSNKGDMAKIVNKYDVGVVPITSDLADYVEAIKKVADNLAYYKLQSNKAARELCAEKEWEKLLKYVDSI